MLSFSPQCRFLHEKWQLHAHSGHANVRVMLLLNESLKAFKKMSQKSFGIQNLYLHESIFLNTVNTSRFLSDMVSTVREILRRGMSVNLYMFHGGSSFGFMSGALANPSYRALVPSYGWFLCTVLSLK